MSDENSNYERRQRDRDEYIEYYNREQERREKAQEALRESRKPRKPYTYTNTKYEKTTFAKASQVVGGLLLIGTLTVLYFGGENIQKSENLNITGGTGIFLIFLPIISRRFGPVLAGIFVLLLIFSKNNGVIDYILFTSGFFISLFINRLFWREKSRETVTVR